MDTALDTNRVLRFHSTSWLEMVSTLRLQAGNHKSCQEELRWLRRRE